MLWHSVNTWRQLGGIQIGSDQDDDFGASVALSADGSILAAGAPQYYTENDLNRENSVGYVKTFRLI